MTPPENIIAIDPGYARRGKGSACVQLKHGRLMRYWFARPESPGHIDGLGGYPLVVVVEQPQLDQRSYHATATVLQLAWEGALLAGIYAGQNDGRVISRTPSEWKGSIPKPAHHVLLWHRLSPEEREMLGGAATERALLAARERGARSRWSKPGASYYSASFTMHNVLDALGLGLSVCRVEAP